MIVVVAFKTIHRACTTTLTQSYFVPSRILLPFFFFSNAFFKKRFASLKFPNVTFLSLLGNPCCKSELVDDSGDAVKAYRDQLVTALPQLGWIDSVVTVADRFTAGR